MFRDYAQRGRKLASQVHPPMDYDEMDQNFIETQEALIMPKSLDP